MTLAVRLTGRISERHPLITGNSTMLQRTPRTLVYRSAAELGITERERAGLIEVRDYLASGRVKHVPNVRCHEHVYNDRKYANFNMSLWSSATDCGTAHCIGGFMRANGSLSRDSGAMFDLFYPGIPTNKSINDLNCQDAVRAIDHFLAGAGADCWPMALADIPAA